LAYWKIYKRNENTLGASPTLMLFKKINIFQLIQLNKSQENLKIKNISFKRFTNTRKKNKSEEETQGGQFKKMFY
jgi:hypothetical protein